MIVNDIFSIWISEELEVFTENYTSLALSLTPASPTIFEATGERQPDKGPALELGQGFIV